MTDENLDLMKETLESAHGYLVKVADGIQGIVVNIQSGREDKAIPVCIDLIDGLKWLTECFELTTPYQEGRGVKIELTEFDSINQQIVEALENRDYVLLGDLLEYELTPIINGWAGKVSKILGIHGEE